MNVPNKSICMAPWSHAFLSTKMERHLCCIAMPTHNMALNHLSTLENFWNGEYMRSVRLKMLGGETLSECQVCNNSELGIRTYREAFNALNPDLFKRINTITAPDGSTAELPSSFDYRVSNSCNFKCQMCGPEASSAWETFLKQANRFDNQSNSSEISEKKAKINEFKNTTAQEELSEAIDSGRLKEIYWVGGEPLSWNFHWETMRKIISNGLNKNIFFRYNTNLSLLSHQGLNFHSDILAHLDNYTIFASIDGFGPIGEWIRDGFNTDTYINNYKKIQSVNKKKDSIFMDVTMTLPGLFSLKELMDLSCDLDTPISLKMILSPSPEIILSPLALPRKILDDIWGDLIRYTEQKIKSNSKLKEVLTTLYMFSKKKNFEELYPTEYKVAFFLGRENLLRNLNDQTRLRPKIKISLNEIYASNPEVLVWWNQKNDRDGHE